MATIPNVVKVEMIYSVNGSFSENVFYMRSDSTPTRTVLIQLGNALVDWWGSTIATYSSQAQVLQKIVLQRMDIENGVRIDFVAGLPLAGNLATPVLPSNVTVCLKKECEGSGRSWRGRFYHVGLQEDQVAGDVVNPTVVGYLKSSYEELLTLAGETSNFNLVLVSYVSNGAPRSTPLVNDVINITCDGIVDSQRRRLSGRGT